MAGGQMYNFTGITPARPENVGGRGRNSWTALGSDGRRKC